MNKFFLMMLVAGGVCLAAEYNCVFTPEGWRQEDWLPVKTPRWNELGAWEQCADHLENRVPAELSEEQLASCHEAYVSMLWKTPVEGDAAVAATMAFASRYAPSIVLAGELGASAACDGMAEYREHWEIVLYADGINVWHHEGRLAEASVCAEDEIPPGGQGRLHRQNALAHCHLRRPDLRLHASHLASELSRRPHRLRGPQLFLRLPGAVME